MSSRISDLAELTTLAADDLVVVVDVSDTTMAATGTTKKVAFNNLQTYPDTYWDDLRVAASTVYIKGSSNVPDWVTINGNLIALAFDDNTMEQVFFNVQIPHSCKLYSNINPHIHCAPMISGTGYIKWGLEYTFANINGFFGLTNIIYGSGLALGSKKHSLCEFPDILDGSISGVS